MWRQSVWSSTIAAKIAAQFLKDGGLLSLPGAKPALGPTPGNIKLSHPTDESCIFYRILSFWTDRIYSCANVYRTQPLCFLYVIQFLAIN
jgi:hypothetical protein